MTTKRKPTLKQLFNAWKKLEKKTQEVRAIRYDIERMARDIGFNTELIADGEHLYRVSTTNNYSYPYEVKQIASTEELNSIK